MSMSLIQISRCGMIVGNIKVADMKKNVNDSTESKNMPKFKLISDDNSDSAFAIEVQKKDFYLLKDADDVQRPKVTVSLTSDVYHRFLNENKTDEDAEILMALAADLAEAPFEMDFKEITVKHTKIFAQLVTMLKNKIQANINDANKTEVDAVQIPFGFLLYCAQRPEPAAEILEVFETLYDNCRYFWFDVMEQSRNVFSVFVNLKNTFNEYIAKKLISLSKDEIFETYLNKEFIDVFNKIYDEGYPAQLMSPHSMGNILKQFNEQQSENWINFVTSFFKVVDKDSELFSGWAYRPSIFKIEDFEKLYRYVLPIITSLNTPLFDEESLKENKKIRSWSDKKEIDEFCTRFFTDLVYEKYGHDKASSVINNYNHKFTNKEWNMDWRLAANKADEEPEDDTKKWRRRRDQEEENDPFRFSEFMDVIEYMINDGDTNIDYFLLVNLLGHF